MSELYLKSKLAKAPNLFEKVVKDGIYLVAPDGSEHFLNATAAMIWTLIDGNSCLASVVESLSARFPDARVAELIPKFTYELLVKLHDCQLVTIDGKSAAENVLAKIDYLKDRDLHVQMMVDYAHTSMQRRIPVKMVLELTDACNVRCKYCYANAGLASAGSLPIETLYSVLDQAAQLGTFHLTLTGGEPLMRRDLMDIVSHAMRLGMLPKIQTNGTLITEKIAQQLAEIGSVPLEVTVLGAKAETHDRFVGVNGAFDKLCQSIKWLRQYEMPITIKFVINKYNFDEAESIMDLADRLDVERVNRTALIYPRFNGDADTLDLRVSDEQLRSLAQRGIYIPHPDPCGAGTNKFTVSPHGDVYACQYIRLSVGNVNHQDLQTIWNSPQMETYRQENWFERPPVCLSCEVKNTCSRCPAIAYHEDGNIHGVSREACRIAHIAVQYKDVLKGD
ncbi:MAG: PqqD family peptide modification chaperone [Candidatus Omnitrophota bacterium]